MTRWKNGVQADMSDYIKREDAVKIINSGISIDTDADKRYVNGLFRAIRPADVAPVRRGHWIKHEGRNGAKDSIECSACGVWIDDMPRKTFCPNCGARMDEEVD